MREKTVIEKGVPVPGIRRARSFPWDEMEVGDSFRISTSSTNVTYANKKYAPRKFTARRTPGGWQVWRIE